MLIILQTSVQEKGNSFFMTSPNGDLYKVLVLRRTVGWTCCLESLCPSLSFQTIWHTQSSSPALFIQAADRLLTCKRWIFISSAKGKQEIVGLPLLRTQSFEHRERLCWLICDSKKQLSQTAVTLSQRHPGDSSFDDQIATNATRKMGSYRENARNLPSNTYISTLRARSILFHTYSPPWPGTSPPGRRWTGRACWPPAWPGLWAAGAAALWSSPRWDGVPQWSPVGRTASLWSCGQSPASWTWSLPWRNRGKGGRWWIMSTKYRKNIRREKEERR